MSNIFDRRLKSAASPTAAPKLKSKAAPGRPAGSILCKHTFQTNGRLHAAKTRGNSGMNRELSEGIEKFYVNEF